METPLSATAPEPPTWEPAGPVKACILSIVCPGLGEVKTGYRRWGLGLLAVFLLCAAWLMSSVYQVTNAVKQEILNGDARFHSAPVSLQDMSELQGLMFQKLLAKLPAISQQVSRPFEITIYLYLLSIIEAPILAVVARRAMPPTPGTAPSP